MLNNKGFFLSSLNIKARELKAHVFVIEDPSSVLTRDQVHGAVLLLDYNYCKIFSEALDLHITGEKKKTKNMSSEWRDRHLDATSKATGQNQDIQGSSYFS